MPADVGAPPEMQPVVKTTTCDVFALQVPPSRDCSCGARDPGSGSAVARFFGAIRGVERTPRRRSASSALEARSCPSMGPARTAKLPEVALLFSDESHAHPTRASRASIASALAGGGAAGSSAGWRERGGRASGGAPRGHGVRGGVAFQRALTTAPALETEPRLVVFAAPRSRCSRPNTSRAAPKPSAPSTRAGRRWRSALKKSGKTPRQRAPLTVALDIASPTEDGSRPVTPR